MKKGCFSLCVRVMVGVSGVFVIVGKFTDKNGCCKF